MTSIIIINQDCVQQIVMNVGVCVQNKMPKDIPTDPAMPGEYTCCNIYFTYFCMFEAKHDKCETKEYDDYMKTIKAGKSESDKMCKDFQRMIVRRLNLRSI
ncbi:unnamed protein product [Oppiella nova]|uniref:Uncharacterized protein n=1 Tax=Oppiella nova TaxID=334625 RepID=A0A7R9LNE6_9ACAR|nr:unnamed protein product [Oppiella nova]CAG2165380.1 unnamed protein product [Oppiella nova]